MATDTATLHCPACKRFLGQYTGVTFAEGGTDRRQCARCRKFWLVTVTPYGIMMREWRLRASIMG